MKEKIIAAIKLKYPTVNLSKPRLNAIAARIEGVIVDDETKIDATLDTFNTYSPFADIAKEDDKMRNLEAKAKTPVPPKAGDEPAADADNPEVTDPVMKALFKRLDTLGTQVTTLQKEKVTGTLKQKAAELLKDVPAIIWEKRALPENEEGLTAFVEDVQKDFTDFNKSQTDAGLSTLSIAKPAAAGAAAAATTKEIPVELKSFMEKEQKANAAPAKATA